MKKNPQLDLNLEEPDDPDFLTQVPVLQSQGVIIEWFKVLFPRNARYRLKLRWPE